MSEVQNKCIEVANLLTNNIRPKLEPELYSNLEELEGKKFGLIYALQLLDKLENPDEYMVVNCQDLYYKLKELADAITFSDIGEISIQNSIYDKINKVCDILNPDCNNQKEIHVRNLAGFSLSSFLLCMNNDEDQDLHSQDPLYEKIAEVFNSAASRKVSEAELSDRINNVINLFNVKSPIRCKIAFINQLSEVDDAINLIAKNENVCFTNYLKFKIDEMYTLLKQDTFHQTNCLLTEIKIVFLTLLNKCKHSLNIKEKIFKKAQGNIGFKTYQYICKLLGDVADFISSKCEKTMRDSCILITIFNIVILMSILV